ncbi:hypothetical protein CCACVL1_18476 [Corchorus capsularis]|uniref:Uncharacterized protein n=1 Tax=Corchorus capsularis TaxID=210143 RepID=A0A1R3HL07_COCAP|nr:hypothetical protein CCACVL1_18476 [Corchorus capsularis]
MESEGTRERGDESGNKEATAKTKK